VKRHRITWLWVLHSGGVRIGVRYQVVPGRSISVRGWSSKALSVGCYRQAVTSEVRGVGGLPIAGVDDWKAYNG